jgi:intraflagellar transport protein 122
LDLTAKYLKLKQQN